MKNVMKEIEKAKKIVDGKYDIPIYMIEDIIDNSGDSISAVGNGFLFGYLQGTNAAKNKYKNINKINFV